MEKDPQTGNPRVARPVADRPSEQIEGWKNPYVLYIVLTLGLFAFLVFMGYLALTQGWIPNRGIG